MEILLLWTLILTQPSQAPKPPQAPPEANVVAAAVIQKPKAKPYVAPTAGANPARYAPPTVIRRLYRQGSSGGSC